MEAGKVFVTPRPIFWSSGGEVKDGMTIEGLGVVHPDFENGNIIVDALQPITVDTVDGLAWASAFRHRSPGSRADRCRPGARLTRRS